MRLPINEMLPIAQLILAVLLHFVWQATLIIGLAAIALSLIQPRYFRLRYGISVLGLVAILIAPMMTLVYYAVNEEAIWALYPPASESGATTPVIESQTLTNLLGTQFQIVFHWFDGHRFFWLGCWMAGLVVLLMRLGLSLEYCFRLRRKQKPLPPHLMQLTERLKRKLNITRSIIVGSSHGITQAVATGIIKPVILVPASWVTQLPVSAIEAILAHELAHIKRWDLSINLLQRLAETVFFFHPLVWWLSHRITSEREVCCDQLAIKVTGQPMRYVQTLAQVAGLSNLNELDFQFGPAFFGGKNMNLLRRAKMILEPASIDAQSPFRTLTFIACLGLLISYGSYAYCTTPDPAAVRIQDPDHSGDRNNDAQQQQQPSDSDGKLEIIVAQEGDQHDGDQHDGDQARQDWSRVLHDHLTQLLHENMDQRDLARRLREFADHLDKDQRDNHSDRDARGNVEAHDADGHSMNIEVIRDDNDQNQRTIKVVPRNANRFRSRQSEEPQEMIIEIQAEGNENANARDGSPKRITLRPQSNDDREKIVIKEVRVQGNENPHQPAPPHFGNAAVSDSELGQAIRDLRNEVQQLRREINQLRSNRNPPPPGPPGPRYRDDQQQQPQRDTDRQGRFEFRNRDNDSSQNSPNQIRWEMRSDSRDPRQDARPGNVWIESKAGKDGERAKIQFHGQTPDRGGSTNPLGRSDQGKRLLWIEEGDSNKSDKNQPKILLMQPKDSDGESNLLHWFGTLLKEGQSGKSPRNEND